MNKRLFIAFPLTSGLYPKINNLEKEISKKLKINWIPLNNLHLTLIFLGYKKIDFIDKIVDILKNTIFKNNEIFKSFNLIFSKVDYGPPGKKRMIWLYIKKNKHLEEIKNKLTDSLIENKIIFQAENREFVPHVNLARLKNYHSRFNKLPTIQKDLNWAVVFNKICLYESYLEKPFARYEELFSFKLPSF
ncbi:MAG: RNA 2',3'-cyclic phosphodiesterase [Candidatus Parcubacteria bacterium]|nr:MAG: RNA 2',3'-cyclic phosphodiesterase [Candidatus Parcubacteria bacterium]